MSETDGTREVPILEEARPGMLAERMTSRRGVLRAAAWSAPVVALALAAPAAAASGEVLVCTSNDPTVESVTLDGRSFIITFRDDASTSVDVTIRQDGFPEIHFNLMPPGSPDNGVAHERIYTPGGVFAITLHRPYNRAKDWQQTKTIHNENCVVIP